MGNLTEKRLKEIAERRGFAPSATEAREMAEMLVAAAEARVDNPEASTIWDFMVQTRGNRTKAAQLLEVNRGTLNKYLDDREGRCHRIINGTLMVATKAKGKNRWQTRT